VDRPTFAAQDAQQARDLTTFKDWWSLDTPILVRNLRETWKKDILPAGTALKQDAEGVWITQNSQRIFVTAATQNDNDEAWEFSVKPKSYEILVLLCWDSSYSLHDFVVPQKLYLGPWVTAKKRAGKENIKFSVVRENGRYLLFLPDFDGIDITETEENYKIIPSY
jgi:tryptophanyl-tRNA synthetase